MSPWTKPKHKSSQGQAAQAEDTGHQDINGAEDAAGQVAGGEGEPSIWLAATM